MSDHSEPAVNDMSMADKIRGGDRSALARAITLIESTRDSHRRRAEQLLNELITDTNESTRIGITGVPGVGKSTFIEALGNLVLDRGHRLAILSVDPSSAISGGSILGDKTRMESLTRRNDVFIRPSPSSGTLGGVARRTRESIQLLEAAGFDFIIVETVGVGQSETLVSEMTDLFLLLLLPGGGDELQGIKRGIMELADIVLVNKADGEMAAVAGRSAAEFANALRLMQCRYSKWSVPVKTCSALHGDGIEEVFDTIEAFMNMSRINGYYTEQRRNQKVRWFKRELNEAVVDRINRENKLSQTLQRCEQEVMAGKRSAASAARSVVDQLFGDDSTR
ncbi:MAG: ATPase/protein kinase [marine bacterium B5-7]|nr:MAG: ATPase/protein kinase [marine bacterium B5-7]